MNIGAIIVATVVVAAVGLFIGIFLGVAGKKFAVETDEKEVGCPVRPFREITAADAASPAATAWLLRSPKERRRLTAVR